VEVSRGALANSLTKHFTPNTYLSKAGRLAAWDWSLRPNSVDFVEEPLVGLSGTVNLTLLKRQPS